MSNKSSKGPLKTYRVLHCPQCGNKFNHELSSAGTATGGTAGAAAGAALGAKIGIVAGPLGAIAGTIPGAILGAIFGSSIGDNFDKPQCPACGAKFSLPKLPPPGHSKLQAKK